LQALFPNCTDTLAKSGHQTETELTANISKDIQVGGSPAIVNHLSLVGESFDAPEILRIKGEILNASDRADPRAEDYLLRSIEWARRQTAPGWELRAAMSLSRIWSTGNRREDALQLLRPIYGKFTEGLETADLRAARLLLDDLGKPTGI
jgi:hypothetical protein